MRQPLTILRYLRAVNAALDVGVRSRRRILAEIAGHLEDSVIAKAQRGAKLQDAEQQAIAAFGSPEEVVRSFASDRAGSIDTRLALAGSRFHGWMAEHAWRWVAVCMIIIFAVGIVVAALGVLIGVRQPAAALTVLPWGLGIMFIFAWEPRQSQRGSRFETTSLTRYGSALAGCPYAALMVYLAMVEYPFKTLDLALSCGVFLASWLLLGLFVAQVRRGRQREEGKTAGGHALPSHDLPRPEQGIGFDSLTSLGIGDAIGEEVGLDYLEFLIHAPVAFLVTVLAVPGAFGFGLALAFLLVALTGALFLLGRVAWNREQKGAIDQRLDAAQPAS